MTSKISFFRLVKDDIRQRMWLPALTSILFLCFYPVYGIMELENRMSDFGSGDWSHALDSTREWILKYMGAGNYGCAVAVLVVAVVSAISAFSYLHNKDKVDFHHSFPVRRGELYGRSYVGSFLMFVVPFLVSYALFFLVVAQKGMLPKKAFSMALQVVSTHVVYFLLIYAVTVIGMMLTGKIIAGVLGVAVMMGYLPVLLGVKEQMLDFFMNSYTPSVHTGIYIFLSPVGNYLEFVGNCNVYGFDGAKLAIVLLASLILTVIGYVLYRVRPLEAAESTLAFSKTAPFIKVLLGVPAALAIATVVTRNSVHPLKWMVLIALLAALILCLCIEFVYYMDIKSIFSGKISTGITIFGVGVILAVLYTDVIGYDSYLPQKEKVSQMSFFTESGFGFFDRYNAGDEERLKECFTEDFDPIYELAEEGIQNTEKDADKELYREGRLEGKTKCVVAYKEKSGAIKYRTYYVSDEVVTKAVTEVCQDKEMQEKMVGVHRLQPEEVVNIYLSDMVRAYEVLDMKQQQRKQVAEGYKKDFANISIEKMMEAEPIAWLEISDSDYNIYDFPVYEENTNTIRALKEAGYEIRTTLSVTDMQKIEVVHYDETTWEETAREEIKDNTQKQKIVDLINSEEGTDFSETERPNMDIALTFKDGNEVSYWVDKEKLEEILQ